MAHMELHTQQGKWYVVETRDGSCVVDFDVVGDLSDRDEDAQKDAILEYTDCSRADRIEQIEVKEGWCARYSANGYLDRTDWCGPYDTEQEAAAEARSLYGEDHGQVEF